MTENEKIVTRTVVLPDDLEIVKKLWFDYLSWGNNTMQELYGVHPHNPQETVAQDILQMSTFQPPHGQIILASYQGKIIGLGSLKSIKPQIGEIKRMFVDSSYRNMGVGRAVLEGLLDEAKKAGYKRIRLESPKFMKAAHSLYRNFGFKDIPVYPEVEIPEEFRPYLLFMELNVSDDDC